MSAEDKQRARAQLTAIRRALLPEDVRARGAQAQARLLAMPEYQRARTVALYAALAGEVPTEALLAAALRDGKRVVFPVVPSEGRRLAFRAVENAAALLSQGRLAILEPQGDRPLVELSSIELFVVPGLGFTQKGDRIGRGAGYYDTTLALAPPSTPRVGLAFSEHVLATLPLDKDDVPMHFVVTEASTYAAPETRATVLGARS